MEQVKFILLGILMGFFIVASINPSFINNGETGEQFHDNGMGNAEPVGEKFGGGVKAYIDRGEIVYDPSSDGPGGN